MIDYEKIILETYGVMTPESLENLNSGDIEVWNKSLVKLHKEKKLNLNYRLRTEEFIEEFENDWVSSLGELAQDFKIKGKKEYIDGTIPENIEVGFRINNRVLV